MSPGSADYWYPVAIWDEVRKGPVGTVLLGKRIVIFDAGGEPAVLDDLCIHRGTPLSMGRLTDGILMCAYHGWKYDRTGACVSIPQLSPGRTIPSKARVTAYRADQRYGLVWVCLGSPRFGIPDCPEYDDPSFRTTFVGVQEWNAGAARMMENFLDVGHFAWVHTGLLGDPERPAVYVSPLEEFDDGFAFVAETAIPTPGRDGWISEPISYRFRLPYSFTVVHERGHTPSAIQGVGTTADGAARRYRLDIVIQPIAPNRSRRFTWISRNHDLDHSLDEAYRSVQLSVAEQDRAIVENQRPEELPLDLAAEMHLKGVDAPAVEFRRLLRAVGLDESSRPPDGGHAQYATT